MHGTFRKELLYYNVSFWSQPEFFSIKDFMQILTKYNLHSSPGSMNIGEEFLSLWGSQFISEKKNAYNTITYIIKATEIYKVQAKK